jgi:HlyD family secretion protein
MIRKRRIVYIVIIVIVAVVIGWLSTPEPQRVKTHTITTGKVEATVTNTRTGTITACRRSHIVPITGGRVDQLLVKEGDVVSKDQLLLSLWNDDLTAQVKLAQSEARATQARAEEVCVMADLAIREAERNKQLLDKGLSSIESFDQAQNNAVARQASCRAAEASIEVAESQLAVAKAALQRTLLKAPYDGVVAEVNADLGEVLAPLSAAGDLMAAVDLIEKGCLYVSAPIDEIDAPAIKPGMPVYITLDAYPNQQFAGEVKRVAPYVLDIEKQARTVEVEVLFSKAEDQAKMLPGFSTDVEIVLDSRDNTLWLPASALLQGNNVWRYQPADGTITRQKVEIGLGNWQVNQITRGLNEGDIIVLPTDKGELSEGMQVIPIQEAP